MTNKRSYIKRVVNYVIVGAILASSLSSAAFGVPRSENNVDLGQSSKENIGASRRILEENIGVLGVSLGKSAVDKELKKDEAGYYLIGSSVDLRKFADKVNSGKEIDAKGKLIKDIEFNGGSVIEKKELKVGGSDVCVKTVLSLRNKGNFEELTPIGTENNPFEGEFIGEEKIIRGAYIKSNKNYQGLFGCIGKKGKVSNIKIDGSYIKGKNYIGGIAGCNKGEIKDCITNDSIVIGNNVVGGNVGKNEGIIEGECKNEREVKGEKCVGGNIGDNHLGRIEGECKNEREVKGKECVGGNIGYNSGTIECKCENIGNVEGTEKNIGGNIGYHGVENIVHSSQSNKGVFINNGNIKGDENVGGNIGLCETEALGEFINNGDVKGQKTVGMHFGTYCKEKLKGAIGGEGTVNGEEYKGRVRQSIGSWEKK